MNDKLKLLLVASLAGLFLLWIVAQNKGKVGTLSAGVPNMGGGSRGGGPFSSGTGATNKVAAAANPNQQNPTTLAVNSFTQLGAAFISAFKPAGGFKWGSKPVAAKPSTSEFSTSLQQGQAIEHQMAIDESFMNNNPMLEGGDFQGSGISFPVDYNGSGESGSSGNWEFGGFGPFGGGGGGGGGGVSNDGSTGIDASGISYVDYSNYA